MNMEEILLRVCPPQKYFYFANIFPLETFFACYVSMEKHISV